ncbi:MAG: hypothetical protein MUC82_02255 [Cypionkella sp.]|jgi:hypothetical protein|nr:hypothetical protein [Cypionkella sp.]
MMATLPYGFDGHADTSRPKNQAEAWERLEDVQLSLEKREAVPRELAAWLGEAIHYANRDPAELLRRLGLKNGRGKPAADPDAWLIVGKRICELEDFGLNPDEVQARHTTMSNPEVLRPYGVQPDEVKPMAIGEIAYERMKPEAALDQVDDETFGKFQRSQLQKFRDAYRAACHVAHNPK